MNFAVFFRTRYFSVGAPIRSGTLMRRYSKDDQMMFFLNFAILDFRLFQNNFTSGCCCTAVFCEMFNWSYLGRAMSNTTINLPVDSTNNYYKVENWWFYSSLMFGDRAFLGENVDPYLDHQKWRFFWFSRCHISLKKRTLCTTRGFEQRFKCAWTSLTAHKWSHIFAQSK